jgi:hypothetical protein
MLPESAQRAREHAAERAQHRARDHQSQAHPRTPPQLRAGRGPVERLAEVPVRHSGDPREVTPEQRPVQVELAEPGGDGGLWRPRAPIRQLGTRIERPGRQKIGQARPGTGEQDAAQQLT